MNEEQKRYAVEKIEKGKAKISDFKWDIGSGIGGIALASLMIASYLANGNMENGADVFINVITSPAAYLGIGGNLLLIIQCIASKAKLKGELGVLESLLENNLIKNENAEEKVHGL